jgi:glycosyltransferase involved in cell wall biosynthesis
VGLVFLIPAYKPTSIFTELVRALVKIAPVYVVNDGSRLSFDPLFKEAESLGAGLMTHKRNKGKGAALRTGFARIQNDFPKYGVLTLDADGQHSIEDVLKLKAGFDADPEVLLLGSRMLHASQVPWRSRLGNYFSSLAFAARTGVRFSDTQTGLRVYPATSLPWLLEVPWNRYEFEMVALYEFVRRKIPWKEIPIQTIYIDGNRGSHFKPLRDSLRIWRALKGQGAKNE